MELPALTKIRDWFIGGDDERIRRALEDLPRESLAGIWNVMMTMLPLFKARPQGYDTVERVLEMFLSAGMGIDDLDRYGNTPLMHTIIHDLDIPCRVLLQAGADVNAYNDQPYNPLSKAVHLNHRQMIATLIGFGAILGGTEHTWDARLFKTAIRMRDLPLIDLFFHQFEAKQIPVPLNEIMTLCETFWGNDCIRLILLRYCDFRKRTDKTFCVYLWNLQWAAREGFPLDIYGSTRKLVYLRPPSIRSVPQFLILLYTVLHEYPPSLQMICAAAVADSLETRPKSKVCELPLPTSLKSRVEELLSTEVVTNDDVTYKRIMEMDMIPGCVKYRLEVDKPLQMIANLISTHTNFTSL